MNTKGLPVGWSIQGAGVSPLFSPVLADQELAAAHVQSVVYRSPHVLGLEVSRWSLETLRDFVPWLNPLSLPGVHKLLKRLKIIYKRGRRWLHSPDPLYEQ